MKHYIFALSLSAAAFTVAAQPLLTPTELSEVLSNAEIRVIDIRDPQAYQEGHIPGAVNAPYAVWRGPAENPGQTPALTELTKVIQNLGLTPETHAVVISSGNSDTDFGSAARVYWTLRLAGLSDLSILHGGMQTWQQQGLDVSNQPVTVQPSDYTPTENASVNVTREALASRNTATSSRLIDARPAAFYEGETSHPGAKVAGTLEGAENLSHALWFKSGGELQSKDEIRAIAQSHGLLKPDQEIVSFCNTGHWAATNWFVLSEVLEQPDVKLYAGSMVDWTQADEALPVQNAPSRVTTLWRQTKDWFSSL
ncbi:sulfurtransferase [Orrella sp. 11846]|uniref:sulfurtransferase n=1 Tax=Orrella sp. 11846 TaxID=3409913 RepID=UPI003B59FB8D